MSQDLIRSEWERKIDALLAQMTLEEKVGQMTQSGISIVGTFGVSFEELLDMMFDGRISHAEFEQAMAESKQDYHEEEIRAGKLGSMNGICGPEITNRLQKIAVEESRLGIPLIFGSDIVHGYRTIFPIPLAMSCSWDPEVVRSCARISAREGASQGLHWTFAPVLDLARDARWGRVAEGCGEDPVLATRLGRAYVEGFQNGDLAAPDSLAACPKHFLAYGAAEGGRDYNSVQLSEDALRDYYLPAFRGAVEAGCATLMPAFEDLNGVPCTQNRWLLETVLRGELGFQGYLVSDANAVSECVNHGTAADNAQAARQAVEAGLDMEMNGPCYAHIRELVEAGSLSMEQVDACVRRILRVKFAKGLFDHPYVEERSEDETLLTVEYRAAAQTAAEQSAVLLKNQGGLLPLDRTRSVAVVGALATAKSEMLGSWAINGRGDDVVSILEGIRQIHEVSYVSGADWKGAYSPEEVAAAVQNADTVIAVVGESADQSGEAASRSDIRLPGQQEALLHQLKALGKRVVCVLINGRPLALEQVEPDCDAILECWQLGVETGHAVANLLFGLAEPSGHLTMSFPRVTGQCPLYYNHNNTGRPAGRSKFTSKYMDVAPGPLYPFGHGLTYTTFRPEGLWAWVEDGALQASWQVANIGARPGVYTAQLYVRDQVASRARPVKELKQFCRIKLAPGETTEVRLSVPVQELGFYRQGSYVVEPGTWTVFAGDSSDTTLQTEITIGKEDLI